MEKASHNFETIMFSKLEKDLLLKLSRQGILTLEEVKGSNFLFVQDLSQYQTLSNPEDVAQEVLDTHILDGIIDLRLLRNNNIKFNRKDLENKNFNNKEIAFLDLIHLVEERSEEIVKEDDDLMSSRLATGNLINNLIV